MRFADILTTAAGQGGGPAGVDADATAYFAAVVTAGGTVSAPRQALLRTFIAAEKAAGTWALTDDYWILAAESATQALVSLKQLRTATATSTFAVDAGYTSNGTTTFVSTGFIPTTHGIVLTLSSIRMAAYERTNLASAGYAAATKTAVGTDAIMLQPRDATDNFVGRAVSAGRTIAGITDSRGLTAISRAGTTDVTVTKNGAALTAGTAAAGSNLPNFQLYIGGQNNAGTLSNARASQVAFVCIGGALSAGQETAQYNNVQAHMTSIGANV